MSPSSRVRTTRHAAALVLALATAWTLRLPPPAAAQAGGAAPPGFDLLRIQGVVGAAPIPGAMLQMTLVVGEIRVPVNVVEVRQANGPGEGRYLLTGRLGEIAPVVRVIGEAKQLDRLAALPDRGAFDLLVQLTAGDKEMLLLSLQPAEASSPVPGPSASPSP